MSREERPVRTIRVGLELDDEELANAAEALRSGRLVVFPTETVYGLGANALDAAAVTGIYAAKGRPVRNPLIVHVHNADAARGIVTTWPEAAERLAKAFWPGPLSIILPKSDSIPDVVSGGGPTVALRSPAHPVALKLIEMAGVPVAAPSANPSGYVSPTRVEHLAESIKRAVEYIVDAGPCPGGIESTVLDLTEDPPRVLRPGLLDRTRLEEALGCRIRLGGAGASSPRSPGLLGRHYAPRATVLVARDLSTVSDQIRSLTSQGKRAAFLTFAPPPPESACEVVFMPREPGAYARALYDVLMRLDRAGIDTIVVEEPPDEPAWEAINDRLRRAALG